jgi:hypothetical protein
MSNLIPIKTDQDSEQNIIQSHYFCISSSTPVATAEPSEMYKFFL